LKETRRFYIKQKIFKKTDFLNIGKIFHKEYNLAQKDNNNSSISFRVDCIDGTSYESESLELFDDGSILDQKKAKFIEISFHNYTLDQYMNISVVHGGGYGDNLIIRGVDSTWVNGIFTRLKEIIDCLKPQDNFLIRHKTALLHIIALSIGKIFFLLISLALDYVHIEPIKNPSEILQKIRLFFATYPYFINLIEWFCSWLMGIGSAYAIRTWLLKLWPDIEFDLGPEHLKIEKLRRMRIAIVFSIGIIPFCISIIYDLVKYYLEILQ